MGLFIQTNVASMIAQNNLSNTSSKLAGGHLGLNPFKFTFY